jgi:hypothetical protein
MTHSIGEVEGSDPFERATSMSFASGTRRYDSASRTHLILAARKCGVSFRMLRQLCIALTVAPTGCIGSFEDAASSRFATSHAACAAVMRWPGTCRGTSVGVGAAISAGDYDAVDPGIAIPTGTVPNRAPTKLSEEWNDRSGQRVCRGLVAPRSPRSRGRLRSDHRMPLVIA